MISTSDPIGLDGGLNAYGYGNQAPLSRIDRYGLDSFLVSRPTVGGARHLFIVHGADAQANGGTIRSFGRQDSSKLGEVFIDTGGFSTGTLQKDRDFWKNKGANVTYSPIPATDEQVECAANNLKSNWLYTYPSVYGLPVPTSGHLTMNSNTAAQAVANYAAGKKIAPPSGWHPGFENYQLINFK